MRISRSHPGRRHRSQFSRREQAELRQDDTRSSNAVFRDANFLDFLGLKVTSSEKDLERAILRELKTFILGLGIGFAIIQVAVAGSLGVLEMIRSVLSPLFR